MASKRKFPTEQFDDLVVEYGRSAGRVIQFGTGYHFSASKDGTYVSVGRRVFDRLVLLGRIDHKGVVIEQKV